MKRRVSKRRVSKRSKKKMKGGSLYNIAKGGRWSRDSSCHFCPKM